MASFMKGVKSIFKGVGKIFKSAFKEIKRFVKSDAFKVIVIAAAIWFGGAALGYWNTGFASIDGALAATTQTGTNAGATIAMEGGSNAAQFNTFGTSATAGAAQNTATRGLMNGGLQTASGGLGGGANIAATQSTQAAPLFTHPTQAGIESMLAAPTSVPLNANAAPSLLSKAGSAVKGAAGWMEKNSLLTLLAGQTLSGAFSPNQLDANEQENQYRIDAENRAKQYTDDANARIAGVGDIPTWRYSGATLPGVPGPRLPEPGVVAPHTPRPPDPRSLA